MTITGHPDIATITVRDKQNILKIRNHPVKMDLSSV